MTIRLRLVISYIAMLIIPVTLTIVSAAVIFALYMGNAQKTYNLGPDFFRNMMNGAFRVSFEIEQIAVTDPDKLEDTEYLSDVDNRLKAINGGIIVRKDDKIIYSSKMAGSNEILARLPSYRSHNRDNYFTIEANQKDFTIKQKNFTFKDNSNGSVFLIADFKGVWEFFAKYFRTLAIVILLILVFTNGIITYLVSRSIIRPLNILKIGTEKIREGNLNFEVNYRENDEIGDVCIAFEQMRRKLHESIEAQIQYEDNRKELISNISHDLKTPITSIKGYVEGIMDGVADTPEKMDKYIKTIYAKASDMDKLIDDLFLFSKLDLKKLPFNFEKVEIKEYFEDCIDEMLVDLEKKGILLDYKIGFNRDIYVVADREKLKRVIINIIQNSVKYMDKEHGKIVIKLLDGKDYITVSIEDNGQGISEEELPYIFERFYRADPSRNTATGGSGLGLAIARQIIKNHDGEIWAQSKYNEGTNISFTLKKDLKDGELNEQNIDN